jgi:hypothetical protein
MLFPVANQVIRSGTEAFSDFPRTRSFQRSTVVKAASNDVDASGHYVLRNHVLVTFVLHNAEVVRLEGFNQQNVLDGLSFTKPEKPVADTMVVEVELESSFGVSAIFQCARGEVVSVEPCEPSKGGQA